MKKNASFLNRIPALLRWLMAVALPMLFLRLSGAANLSDWIIRIIFTLAVLLWPAAQSQKTSTSKREPGWFSITAALVGFSLLGLTTVWENTLLAWVGLLAWMGGLLALAPSRLARQNLSGLIFDLALSAGLAGGAPILLNQVLIRFSEEEFFMALGVLMLMGFWLLLWFCRNLLLPSQPIKIPASAARFAPRRWVLRLGMILFGLGLTFWVGRVYQHSFYPTDAPNYPGITESSPFICAQVEAAPTGPDAQSVRAAMAAGITQKETLTTNEIAFLALVQADPTAAQTFKTRILQDAHQGLYTQPANSIKYDQYLAAQTLYFYDQVQHAFPNLFSVEEKAEIETWAHQINQRAQTVEWVDWLYALAFSKAPAGAYENQEIGAGLYALLEATHLASPKLSAQNQAYLESFSGGWAGAFRVIDDAITYQPVWITNAYLQSLYNPDVPQDNLRLAFEWLLIQSLPDGAPMGYNFPYNTSLAAVSLFGAMQLQDGRLLWLANQSLDAKRYLTAQPGTEQPVPEGLLAVQPDIGSCLVFGSSGLPEQHGPLAPDKVIFRTGWEEDDLYLMVNLRFTGWHRYKATNTIPLIYAGEALIKDSYTTEPIAWLPEGRATVRDKRIPRENLNGLLVPRRGLDAALQTLLGVGSFWAQDPPYYAEVVSFSTSDALDVAKISLPDWHGWQHNRTIFFYRNGPVFILDDASGPKSHGPIAINWNFASEIKQSGEHRFNVGSPPTLEMVLLGQSNGHLRIENKNSEPTIAYMVQKENDLNLLTILLTEDWLNAEIVSTSYYENHIEITFLLNEETHQFFLEYP